MIRHTVQISFTTPSEVPARALRDFLDHAIAQQRSYYPLDSALALLADLTIVRIISVPNKEIA